MKEEFIGLIRQLSDQQRDEYWQRLSKKSGAAR